MLCLECGFANVNDSNFCAMCGVTLTPTTDRQVTHGTVPCASCSFLNEEVAEYCRACGGKIKEEVAAGIPLAALRQKFASPSGAFKEAEPFPLIVETVDEKLDPSLYNPGNQESLLSLLDRMEQEISARLDEKIPALEPEAENWDEREGNLTSLSCTLDELLADLIDAEINEYLTPDFIHPDETGFPEPFAVERKPRRSENRFVDLIFILALIIAIFLFGVTTGLWGSYALGF